MTDTRQIRRGFTFVELAVVMAILAVLLALLMPVVSRARRQARTAYCAHQLHQIYLAASQWKVDAGAQQGTPAMPALGWRSAFYQYTNTRAVYICPEDSAMGGEDGVSVVQVASTGTSTGAGATTGGSGGSTSPGSGAGTTTLGDLETMYVAVYPDLNKPPILMVPVTPGPWTRTSNLTSNGYDLGIEDIQTSGSDFDYDDIVLHLTDMHDGTTMITVKSRAAAYHFDLVSSVNGVVGHLLSEPAGTAPAGSSFLTRGTTPDGSAYTKGGGGVMATGGSGSASGTGAGATSTSGTPGFSTDSSYGLNASLEQVFGNVEKVMGLDYRTSVADVVDNWLTVPYMVNGQLTFPRHNRQVNVLYGDGSVSLNADPRRSLDPATGSNATRVWKP